MRKGWLGLVVAGMLAGLLAPAAGGKTTRPGCGSNPATAYGPDGKPLAHQPAGAPVPCLVPTGYGTVETHIAITGDGTLVYEPAVVTPGLAGTDFVPGAPGPHPWTPLSPAGFVSTQDAGGSWRFVAPAGTLWAPNDNALWADPATGRLFAEMLAPGQAPAPGVGPQEQAPGTHAFMLTSDDDGRTWSYTTLTGFALSENARFAAAPPPAGGTQPVTGYPDVTYWCGNREVGLTEPLILERECYRSLDAGTSWEMRSILFTNPVPQHPECGTDREDINSVDGNYPEGAPDGSLYVMVGCTPPTSPTGFDGVVYLARSTDEAGTFPVLHNADGTPVTLPVPANAGRPELRVTAGHLVLVFQVGNVTVFQTAPLPQFTSGGRLAGPLQWSAPVTLTPAGLSSVDRWAVDVRGTELVLSSIAGTASGTYDGLLTVVPNVLSPGVIWTGDVGMLSKTAPQEAKDDFIGVAIGPDGGPWASYFSPCSSDPNAATDPACEGAYANGQPVNSSVEGGGDRGMVGSLLFG